MFCFFFFVFFQERQFLVASILVEFLVSANFYILRGIYLPQWSPGAIFLALFLRSQVTNTLTLGLIFIPKLWYQHKQVSTICACVSTWLCFNFFFYNFWLNLLLFIIDLNRSLHQFICRMQYLDVYSILYFKTETNKKQFYFVHFFPIFTVSLFWNIYTEIY